jgi:hypothetical protein
MATAVAVPYAVNNTGLSEKMGLSQPEAAAHAPATPGQPGAAHPHPQGILGLSHEEAQQFENSLAVPKGQDLADVLRFNLTPGDVMSRWPRVSTRLAKLDLLGYRVPLMSGPREDDLAGSLTYYFTDDQRLQRIVFLGTTGDARRIVDLVTQRFHFERNLMGDPSLYLYQVKSGKKAVSELRIRPANVIEANKPYERFEVSLWIERPEES